MTGNLMLSCWPPVVFGFRAGASLHCSPHMQTINEWAYKTKALNHKKAFCIETVNCKEELLWSPEPWLEFTCSVVTPVSTVRSLQIGDHHGELIMSPRVITNQCFPSDGAPGSIISWIWRDVVVSFRQFVVLCPRQLQELLSITFLPCYGKSWLYFPGS